MRTARSLVGHLDPEKVAYCYFRFNGFFQIENFVAHRGRRGAQQTDTDLLAVRFPFRAERSFDDPTEVTADDVQRLALAADLIDVAIVEVKTNTACTLNGPWTQPGHQHVHRILAAIGCLPAEAIEAAAADIYNSGFHRSNGLRIRLVAVGRNRNEDLAAQYPWVVQVLWPAILAFIWDRFRRLRPQKTQASQWDMQALNIKRLADCTTNANEFVQRALPLMGVRHP